jgi:hypothetical protein
MLPTQLHGIFFMGLFAKDLYRSLFLGFAIGTVGMGVSFAARVHAAEVTAPAPIATSAISAPAR